jgi:dual specificity phosphatase 12
MSSLNQVAQPRSALAPGLDVVLNGRLYLSSLSSAQKVIESPSIFTHVISVCPDLPRRNENHLIIPINDTEYENIIDYLLPACQFIDDALASGGCVLVHCVMGISRSATVVAAYLMKKQSISAEQALAFLTQCAHSTDSHIHFVSIFFRPPSSVS